MDGFCREIVKGKAVSTLKYWVWLSSLSGVGPITAKKLLERFETVEKVFFARDEEYEDVPGIRKSEIAALSKKNIGSANKILSECEENNFRIITIQDAEYPERLRNIYDPPIVLYIKGRLPVIDEEAAVAIVGSRSCTPYGTSAAEKIGYELARHGLVVVTGLARGIDSAAAKGALRGGGRVLGVLGCGLDIVYPAGNKPLFEDVSAAGALISEYPPGSPAEASHFPIRNRIISGISLGVAVIEAPKKSGALITAARALEQGRDVFALPGNVDAQSCEGSNLLLKEGALPLISAVDIAQEYAGLFPEKIIIRDKSNLIPLDKKSAEKLVEEQANSGNGTAESDEKVVDNDKTVEYIDLGKLLSGLSGDERLICEAIGNDTVHVDEIIQKTELSAQVALSTLTVLEINGIVEQYKGKYFRITR